MIGYTWRSAWAIGWVWCAAVRSAAAQSPGADILSTTGGSEASRVRERVLGRKISLSLEHGTLAQALDAIAIAAHVRFGYSRDQVPLGKPVSLVVDTITVADALTVLLRDTGVSATVSPNGRVILTRVGVSEPTGVAVGWQSGGTLAGRVTDATTRTPLDRVAVRVEGPALGAVTTSSGDFVVHNILPGTYRVTARRVGYTPLTKTVAVAVDSTTAVDFALSPVPTRLNEMVTVAVGDQRRYQVGNSIATINADSITPTAPIVNLTDVISARASGVTVEETGGLAGSGEAIRIRGQSSLLLQSDPIVIVDGVRQNNNPGGMALANPGFVDVVTPAPSRLNDINANDIESINILKGPSASTEYGTDAANGVIVITTKHGSAGAPRWQVSAEQGLNEIPERFPALYYSWGHTTGPAPTPVQCPLVSYAFGSGQSSIAGTCAVDSVTTWDPLNHAGYSIFKAGARQKYDLSVSGGSESVRYFLAGNLSTEAGVLHMPTVFVPEATALGLPHSAFDPNNEHQRSVRTNTAIRLGPTVDLAVSGAYLATYQTTPIAQRLVWSIVTGPPLRDSSHLFGYGSEAALAPIYQFGNPTSQNSSRLTGGMVGTWHPTLWLTGRATVGVDHGSGTSIAALLPQAAPLYAFAPAQLSVENATTDIYTADLMGSATATLTRALRAVTTVGMQLADQRNQGTQATAVGVTATNFTLNGSVGTRVVQLGDRRATLGGYGEEQLAVADRLFLTGALRIDAGSGFGRNYSTAAYPKASASWLLLADGPTTLRLRGAFGESGVQPPNGAALALYGATTDWSSTGAVSAASIANIQNQLLHPERSVEYEGGLDFGMWHNRASVELTAYSKTTRDALVTVGTGWDAGGFPYTENVGTVRNVGVEGGLTATVLQSGALTWDVTLNGSVNRNKLVTLAPGLPAQTFSGFFANYEFARGYPLYGYWGPRAQYADLNHDGVIEPNEVTVAQASTYVGSSAPTREISLGSHLQLFDGAVALGGLVDYRGGFRLLNGMALSAAADAAQSDAASNHRTAPLVDQARDVAQEIVNVTGVDNRAAVAGFYQDATYARIRELSLTYTLPPRITRALRLQQTSITGAVRNLALWTRYGGTDPEVTNSVGFNAQLSPTSNTFVINHDEREDVGAVPLLRYWVVRLNLGF